MICGNRIYKGSDVIISVPFAETDYSDLSLRLYTNGEYSIERVESGMTISDGMIVVGLLAYELGLLADGILYYTINYTYDGYQLSQTTNTPYILKTPNGYSAQTPEEIYQMGYDAGLEACEHPEYHLQTKSVYRDGDSDGTFTILPDSGYVGMSEVEVNVNDFGEAAYRRGVAWRASLLSSMTATANGRYTSELGWSAVTVNIDTPPTLTISGSFKTNIDWTLPNDGSAEGWPFLYLDGRFTAIGALEKILIDGVPYMNYCIIGHQKTLTAGSHTFFVNFSELLKKEGSSMSLAYYSNLIIPVGDATPPEGWELSNLTINYNITNS